MKAKYYDPLFYISSEEMPFSINVEINLHDEVKPDVLEKAAATAIGRFPYFSVKVIRDGEEYLCAPNDKPFVVYEGPEVIPLGSEELNGHIAAIMYKGKKLNFFVTHVITDGSGFVPFIRSVLYYYCTEAYNEELDTTDTYLADSPFFDDELCNPYPEEKMKSARPLFVKKPGEFLRLCEGPIVTDSTPKEYRVRVREDQMMKYSFDHDGSPCALISSLMTTAIWRLHPEEKRSIVCAVSFNLRPGLGNRHNYRMLCSSILLEYPNSMRGWPALKLCTCSRGMVTLQSQAENVLAYAEERRRRFDAFSAIPTLEERMAIVGKRSLEDSVANTFSISYVGKKSFGEMEKHIDSMYISTDGSAHKTLFIEVASMGGYFNLSFIQGFSTDAYYREFLGTLDRRGITYEEDTPVDFIAPSLILPK